MQKQLDSFTADRFSEHAAPFRRQRAMYIAGVVIVWIALMVNASNWPGTSNVAAPGKAECFTADHVIGGAALTWLVLGLRRITGSLPLRSDWRIWVAVAANLVATLRLFSTSYL